MKFGDTLYQRSVPKWAAYNVNYNELKNLIKLRTTQGVAAPMPIPGQLNNRWAQLDQELFSILKQQHDNVSLFCRSKCGEIERRLLYLEKQVRSAQRATQLPQGRPLVQARKWQRLVRDAEDIGEDIQALSRFASVQKTAFRKILKKYRKWTGSIHLQTRLDNEVFSAGQLQLDFPELLRRLTAQSAIITEQLAGPMLRGEAPPRQPQSEAAVPVEPAPSTIRQINDAAGLGGLSLDAALATVAFGKAAGTATYWIHPDNLEEAQVLLLRHVRRIDAGNSRALSRGNSSLSVATQNSSTRSNSGEDPTHVVLYDNIHRFLHNYSTSKPSKIALSGRWSQAPDAVVTLSNLSHNGHSGKVIRLKRKDFATALARDGSKYGNKTSTDVADIRIVQDYLSEHRDIKPLAETHSVRSRYVGLSNSNEVATWATLDTSIVLSPLNNDNIGATEPDVESGEAFPHAVLAIRWEFGRKPEVVRAFDTTHLAERVNDFSIESAAVHSQHKDVPEPAWRTLLEKDIRKVPIVSRGSATRRRGSVTTSQVPVSSGPSSTDGPAESVFSAPQGHSTAASETSPNQSVRDVSSSATTKTSTTGPTRAKKKRARINAVSPARPPAQRYWNEYDDGDSDTNRDEGYVIYVDPNEGFPGAETMSKVFAAIHQSLGKGTSKLVSWLPLPGHPPRKESRPIDDRTPLLFPSGNRSSDRDADSSDSDGTSTAAIPTNNFGAKHHQFRTVSRASRRARTSSVYKPGLSRRQRALERTLFQFYTGLLGLSYVFLLMSGILLATGRRKVALEVDAGAIIGVVAAELCAAITAVLVFMRKKKLGALHGGLVAVAVTGDIVIGAGLLVGIVGRMA